MCLSNDLRHYQKPQRFPLLAGDCHGVEPDRLDCDWQLNNEAPAESSYGWHATRWDGIVR